MMVNDHIFMQEKKILFVCLMNQDRSKTAEIIYKNHPDLLVKSAGVSEYANTLLTAELIEWANIIFVMEEYQKERIQSNYAKYLTHTKIFVLDIENKYFFMQPQLMSLLKQKIDVILKKQYQIDNTHP